MLRRLKAMRAKILLYGTYAVLCHAVAIFLFACLNARSMPVQLLERRCGEWLEYTAMSLLICVAGAFCVYYAEERLAAGK